MCLLYIVLVPDRFVIVWLAMHSLCCLAIMDRIKATERPHTSHRRER